jgi:hypothetical protein
MPPQRFLDLVQHLHSFGVGLPFPEHQKTLPANTAMKLSVSVCFPAQHLHRYTSSLSPQKPPQYLDFYRLEFMYNRPVVSNYGIDNSQS